MKYQLNKTTVKDFIQDVFEIEEMLYQGGFKECGREEILRNFREHYAKNNNLSKREIIQGENEISLALIVNNLIKSKENWN
jgi:hypothetical protein